MLDSCATQQDYLWFLAVLAWGGVLAAVARRPNAASAISERWKLVLALSYAVGAILELSLLAQDLKVPYTRFDFLMGVAQAGGAGALVWAALEGVRFAGLARALILAALGTLAVGRVWFSMEAGFALAMVQAVALLGLRRRRPAPFSDFVIWLLILQPLVATHGPLAEALGQARRITDWSRFALPAAGVSLATATMLAVATWRQRHQEIETNLELRRDLRRALLILACWLVCGVALTVWFGRTARRAFEENLLRRVEIVAQALDPAALADAFGPELKIESIVRSRYPDGAEVDVATAPRTAAPRYEQLREQLRRIRKANDDFKILYLATWRQGFLFVLDPEPAGHPAIRHVVDHAVTPVDLRRLADRTGYLEGPVRTTWGTLFSAKAPLTDASGRVLGWLVADVPASRWAASFVAARLQTMALVGVGVGLWISAVAYRFRRAGREAAEQKALAATSADRMKSAFLAKVSHELRTPIQSVLGYSELLAGLSLPASGRTWLGALRAHSDMMLRLVNDLIDLGALQSGLFQLHRTPIHLRELVAECSEALQPAARAKGLAFVVSLDPDLPDWVLADGVRIRQILLNLLNNAVKFTPAGSVRFEVTAATTGEIDFLVADTGPGIPASQRERLYQPFSRPDQTSIEGSGLGLALVHALCAAMDGRVELIDAGIPGATFRVSLPLSVCSAPPPSAGPSAGGKPDFAGRRILVAEDNTLVRDLLTAFLIENGAEVAAATDGQAALHLARSRPYDALLLDIALPKLDGIAVAQTLRQEGLRRLRIVGLSAHAGEGEAQRARAAGMDIFLAKPVRLAQLAEALQQLLKGPSDSAVRAKFAGAKPDLLPQLWATFNRELPHVLDEMRAALRVAAWDQLRQRAHYLKNSADTLGAPALQQACWALSRTETLDPVIAAQLLARIESTAVELAASGTPINQPELN